MSTQTETPNPIPVNESDLQRLTEFAPRMP